MIADRRILVLGGLAAGLALAPLHPLRAGLGLALAALACTTLVAVVPPRPGARLAAAAAVLLAAPLAGFLAGGERLAAIDAGAFHVTPGLEVEVEGFVAAVPRRSSGVTRIPVESSEGRLLVEVRGPAPDLAPGRRISARGVVRNAPDWYADTLRRQGISQVLDADRVEVVPGTRGGLSGRLDDVRDRAAAALTHGLEPREGALALGFVLGQDDRIDPLTEERFRRSGLAHLLAVSGQNVLLLVLLAAPVLALLGFGLRSRLWLLIGLIALYVPLAGAGPSIQRAGVMGAAGLVALLAGRPSSRLFALLAAAAATLALNPRAAGDAGWQLSFAAVLGIFVLAPPLRRRISAALGPGRARAALAEGMAVTVAATLVTAPVSAHHFEAFSFAALPANLLVLPAVAPAMWLGMAVAALAQLPAAPIAPLNALNEVLLGYIAQVAAWLGDPAWAQTPVSSPSPIAAGGAVGLILGAGGWLLWRLERRRSLSPPATGTRRRLVLAAAAAGVAVVLGLLAMRGNPGGSVPPDQLRVTVLDVGQGDSILMQPGDGHAVLVDAGPPGGAAADALREHGVTRLAAAVITHDQSDHAGGLGEVLAAARADRLLFARAGEALLAEARASGARPTRVAEGSEVRSGSLRVSVLWPPRESAGLPAGGADPNAASLVLLARWHDFEILLTGDAEAEAVPLDPGPVDVLKVSHHGSADSGLSALLDRAAPSVAVISVGDENPYGHPTPEVLGTLEAHGVAVMRTDKAGEVVVEVARDGFEVQAGA